MSAWLIGAGIGAALSGIQSANENAENKRAKRKYLEYLDKVKVSPLEEQKLLDSTGDVYMNQIMDTMNSSVGQGNLYNRDTAMALMKAKGLDARAGAISEQKKSIFNFNKDIDMKKAGVELSMPDRGLDFGAIAAGGIAGAQLGMGIESAIAENKYLDKIGDKIGEKSDKDIIGGAYNIPFNQDTGQFSFNIPATVPGISAPNSLAPSGLQPIGEDDIPEYSSEGADTRSKGKRTGYFGNKFNTNTSQEIQETSSTINESLLSINPGGFGWSNYLLREGPKQDEWWKGGKGYAPTQVKPWQLPKEIRGKGRYKSPNYSNFFDF